MLPLVLFYDSMRSLIGIQFNAPALLTMQGIPLNIASVTTMPCVWNKCQAHVSLMVCCYMVFCYLVCCYHEVSNNEVV